MAESIRKEDWERFRASGSVSPGIRKVVLGSWVRSRRENGVDALTRAPNVAQHELSAIRSRNTRLLDAAQAAFRRAGHLLEDSGAILLLCDRSSIIMDVAGDSRIRSRGEENHLHPGGRWDEGAIGTNAIGTALHLGEPVTISGAEHFCEAIQRWSCAAAPVRDPQSGQVLGAVDLSGPSGEVFGPASALSVTLAHQIEEALRSADLRERNRLIELLLARRASWTGDDVLLFDRHGREIWSSRDPGDVAQDLGEQVVALHGLSGCGESDARLLAARLRGDLPAAGIDLVEEDGEALGVAVTLQHPRKRVVRGVEPAVTLEHVASGGPEMAALCMKAARLVADRVPLLIEGATGSGKETLARALHAESRFSDRPFEILDCSLLAPDSLRADPGLARLAGTGGTLCLDELAETPVAAQPALAQVLALLVRESAAPLQILTLSSVNLAERVAAGHLLRELQDRAAGAVLLLPALAQRREEIGGLARRFAQDWAAAGRGKAIRFSPAVLARLRAYDWPGNLRELRNLVASLSATSSSRSIDLRDLPAEIAAASGARREETLRARERTSILNAVAEAGGNMSEAARRLGISRSTLYLKLDQYGASPRRRG